MTRRTRSRVSSETSSRPLRTRETVAIETPAWSAMCRIVVRRATWAMQRIEACFGNSRKLGEENPSVLLDFHRKIVVNGSGNVSGKLLSAAFARWPGEKGQPMRRSLCSTRRLAAVAAAAGCAALATVLTAGTPAAVGRVAAPTAAHRCLVMTGSGDPAFIKNFNPYTATGQPSGAFVQGAFYEPLIITGEGGLKPVPWLARSWKWSNGNKTLTLNLARGVKWSDGKSLNAADVVYSITAGRQDKLMDRVGLVGAGNNIASVKAKGAYKVVIGLKTPDSQ